MADLLTLSTGTLTSIQRALSTTGHNISNANVEGFSRQTVEMVTRDSQNLGGFYFGSGVKINDVDRVVANFINTDIWNTNATYNKHISYLTESEAVDNFLSDPAVSIMDGVGDFFDALQSVASHPSDEAVRTAFLNQSGILETHINLAYENINGRYTSIANEIKTIVPQINIFAQSIADINVQISDPDTVPPDLRDKQEQLIKELSELIGVTSLEQSDGKLNVFIGSGQTLVLGTQVTTLDVANNLADASLLEVEVAATSTAISNQLSGGKLGGLLSVRSEILNLARNNLGRVAVGLSELFNTQHNIGMDFTGGLGADFFTDPNAVAATQDRILAHASNVGAATITSTITDVNQLTDSDYKITFSGGGVNYTLSRLSDNTTISSAAIGALPSTITTNQGFSFTFAAGSTFNNVDSYIVSPTRYGARDFALNVTSHSQIASAAPIKTEATQSNKGTGVISNGVVTNAATFIANDGYTHTVTFSMSGANLQYTITNTGGLPVIGPTNYTAGANIVTNEAVTLVITGTPAAGDTFTIKPNTGGVNDSRNMLLLGDLQHSESLGGSSATFQGTVSSLLSTIGAETQEADLLSESTLAILNQLIDRRDSISGVNLDEEAANLLKFEQLYNAAAQLVNTSNKVFEALLVAVRGG